METEKSAIVRAGESGGSIAAFSSEGNFVAAQRMAKALSQSSLVPDSYRNNLPNVLVAMELASRIGASVFAVMQNTDLIHGRPSLRAQFLIATANASGKFTPIRYRWQGKEGTDSWGCRAWAKDLETGDECVGSLITIGLAKAENWYSRNGSKWKTIPEQMLMYRAATFWTRIYAPELSLGMHTVDEVIDSRGIDVSSVEVSRGSVAELEAELVDDETERPTATEPSDPAAGSDGIPEPGAEG